MKAFINDKDEIAVYPETREEAEKLDYMGFGRLKASVQNQDDGKGLILVVQFDGPPPTTA